MNIDFLANINKTSGTQFNQPEDASASAAPGFREQIDRAIRDNDRKNEPAVEKKPVEKKKPYAAASEERNSVKTAKKAEAPKKNDRTVQKNTDKEAAAAKPSDNTEEAPETARPKFVLTGEEYPGLNDGLEKADVSETGNVYMFAPAPVADDAPETEEADVSETENVYLFAPVPDDASETEGAFTYIPPAAESGVPDELADSTVSSSTDSLLFPVSLIQNDSGFEAIMNADDDVENTGTDAGVNAGMNAVQNGNTGALPPPAAEVISNMVVTDGAVAVAQQPGTANVNNVNIEQNASFSGSDAANGEQELMAATDAVKLPDEESAQTTGAKEILENALLQKNQASDQNPVSNAAVTPSRGESARAETESESKSTEDAELDISNQQALRASSENSENDELLMERLTTQTLRPREASAFANVSENAGKTVQAAGTTVHVTSGAEKADASVPTRSVNTPDMDFIVELAGRIQAQIRGGREMIRIQLHPEELGRLEIHAESGRNGIIARIAAESLDVKKLLENNIQNLQQTLEARGLKIDRLHIIVEDSAYAAFADAGRYGYNGTGARDAEISEFSGAGGAKMEPLPEDDSGDLSAEAERRGAGFYTVG